MPTEVLVSLIGAGLPALATVFNVVYTNVKVKHKKQSAEEAAEQARRDEIRENLALGTQCLLRAEIIRQHEKYMDRGYCPVYAREALTRVYESYHALGGNGTMTELYKQVMALPTDEREVQL